MRSGKDSSDPHAPEGLAAQVAERVSKGELSWERVEFAQALGSKAASLALKAAGRVGPGRKVLLIEEDDENSLEELVTASAYWGWEPLVRIALIAARMEENLIRVKDEELIALRVESLDAATAFLAAPSPETHRAASLAAQRCYTRWRPRRGRRVMESLGAAWGAASTAADDWRPLPLELERAAKARKSPIRLDSWRSRTCIFPKQGCRWATELCSVEEVEHKVRESLLTWALRLGEHKGDERFMSTEPYDLPVID